MTANKPVRLRRERARAIDRTDARKMGWARLGRTIVLGAVAVVVAMVWLGEQYGIERRVMLEFVGTSVLFVGLLVLAGVGGAVILRALRNLRK
jgi:hypothetical protein